LAYDSAISPVSFNAGNTYWISILENDPSTTFADHWIWQTSDNWTVAGFSERANTSFARAAGVK
jgi:hypothetical protein